jgi:hypothetical protein
VDARETRADVTAPVVACHRFHFGAAETFGLSSRDDTPWPRVVASYTSLHQGPEWTAVITWAALLDTGTMTWLARVPVAVSRTARAARETMELIVREPAGAGEVLFRGRITGRSLRYPCAMASCTVPPEKALELW